MVCGWEGGGEDGAEIQNTDAASFFHMSPLASVPLSLTSASFHYLRGMWSVTRSDFPVHVIPVSFLSPVTPFIRAGKNAGSVLRPRYLSLKESQVLATTHWFWQLRFRRVVTN